MTDSTPEGDVLSTAEREGIVDQQDAVLAAMDRREGRDLAVVTGASSGIGLELSKQFAEHGFDLVVAAEDEGSRCQVDPDVGDLGAHRANFRRGSCD